MERAEDLEDGEMEDVEGMKLNSVVEKVRGDEGSTVRLKVVPADDPTLFKEVTLKRAKVELKESLAKADLIETKDAKGEVSRRDMPSTTPYHLATCYQGLIEFFG